MIHWLQQTIALFKTAFALLTGEDRSPILWCGYKGDVTNHVNNLHEWKTTNYVQYRYCRLHDLCGFNLDAYLSELLCNETIWDKEYRAIRIFMRTIKSPKLDGWYE